MNNHLAVKKDFGVVAPVRDDVRGMFRHCLVPFKATQPWREAIDIVADNSIVTQKDGHGELTALSPSWTTRWKEQTIRSALAVREATLDIVEAVGDALEAIDAAMEPPAEEVVRKILSTMLKVLQAKPSEDAVVYVDFLVGKLMEPESGDPFCAPAIAAAADEWCTTKIFRPAIPEFLDLALKHQRRVSVVRCELVFIQDAYWASKTILAELAPEKLPKRQRPRPDDEDDEPF